MGPPRPESAARSAISRSTPVARAADRRHGFGRGDALVLAATILWSISIVVVKLALANSGPLTLSTLRFLLGGLCPLVAGCSG